MQVVPYIPIAEALEISHSDETDDYLTYQSDEIRYVIHRDDLKKMADMGLVHLPVDCIALAETSPLLASKRTQLTTTRDYSRRLSGFFPVYFVAALYELQSLMNRLGMRGYVVGGITRDLLLYQEKRLEVHDVDITVEGDGLALAQFLQENSRNFQVQEAFPEFGTAKVQYKDSLAFDIASTRKEIYPHCGALPVVVERGVPLIEDIIRRDFTINALAFAIHELGQVLDYSNGIRDIENRVIRVLHPVSFFEDPTRILRALKFCARFNLQLSKETQRLLENFLRCVPEQYKGGGERIKQELKGFLSVPESAVKRQWIYYFLTSGCYRLMNMELAYKPSVEHMAFLEQMGDSLEVLQEHLSSYLDEDFVFSQYLYFILSELPEEAFQKTIARLGLTRQKREAMEQARSIRGQAMQRFGNLNEYSAPAEIYDLFKGLSLLTVAACLVEIAQSHSAQFRTLLEAFLKYKRKWETLELELDGNDLIELGLPKGKAVGQMLDLLLHAKLAGQVPERMDEIMFVQQQLGLQTQAGDHASLSE